MLNEIQHQTRTVLIEMANLLNESSIPGEIGLHLSRHALTLEKLAQGVDEPCVVAVVGRVKTGKSTFINALLEQDLAQVGVTEATATINYFRYGSAPLIRCYWNNGQVEEVDEEFVKKLQGYDDETLGKADAIDYLEYVLPNEILRRVTLVDTPGTSASIPEHGRKTAEFLNLGQLQKRLHQETLQIGREADIIIYLVGTNATQTDRDFLESISEILGDSTSAFHSLGVISRIDLNPDALEKRYDTAARLANHLKDELSTVFPVCAALDRSLARFDSPEAFENFVGRLRQIPAEQLKRLLSNSELFRFDDVKCTVGAAEREDLRGNLPWPVFATIAREVGLHRRDATEIELFKHLRDIAGIDYLRSALETTFFQRGAILRCHSLLRQAERVGKRIRFYDLPRLHAIEYENQAKSAAYIDFLRRAEGDEKVRLELEELIEVTLLTGNGEKLREIQDRLEEACQHLLDELEIHDGDVRALQKLKEENVGLGKEERRELERLFGFRGLETEARLNKRTEEAFVRERIMHWREQELFAARTSPRRILARQAGLRYSQLLTEVRGN